MNEFTKDELKEIQSALSIFSGSPRGNSIFHKIKSMIDNHCGHECSHHELVRLRLLTKKEYDFCETCLFIRRMR